MYRFFNAKQASEGNDELGQGFISLNGSSLAIANDRNTEAYK